MSQFDYLPHDVGKTAGKLVGIGMAAFGRRMQKRPLVQGLDKRQQRVTAERKKHRLFSLGQSGGMRAFGPIFRSSTVARLRHFATVF